MRAVSIILVLILGVIISLSAIAKDKTLEMIILGENETYSGSIDGEDNLIISIWNMLRVESPIKLSVGYQQVSMSRSWAELIRLDNACVMNKLKTADRLDIAEYSQYPLSVFPPIRLITLARNESRFKSPFSFQQLEHNPALKLGVVKSRTYGVELDAQIEKYAKHIFTRGGIDSSDKLVDMLLAGRLDGILEYTLSIEGYLQDEGIDERVIALPITDISELMLGYIACSKTIKGGAIIDAINSSFTKPGVSQAYIDMHINHFGVTEAELLKPKLDSLFTQ
ncbi:hypothetical protein [Shewanella sp. UCD-KL12]|uniref:hypothetical protein n=1 Tax=Shewanella sp. UCD-KL12 TaxID=1917163 RepID=UPI0009712E5A|nr:hypothetical protein [Shewanella sp. UCD-KL12]